MLAKRHLGTRVCAALASLGLLLAPLPAAAGPHLAAPVVLVSISPGVGLAAGGTPATIVGADLTGAVVTFGPATATVVADTDTTIGLIVPAGRVGSTVPVTVMTPDGAAAAGTFTYVA